MTRQIQNRKGIAIPIVLVVVLCFGCYIVSLSWSMSNARSRYQQTLNNRRAYFMARSGMEHIMLKLKTMQRHCCDSMMSLENAPEEDKDLLYKVFTEDVLIPPDNHYTGEKFEYRVNDFGIESVDLEACMLTLRLEVLGKYGSYQNSIKRLIRISR